MEHVQQSESVFGEKFEEELTSMDLETLQLGDFTPGDSTVAYNRLPPDLDMERFNRGRQFFRTHVFSCVTAMLCSLVCGLSVINLLKPLVFTGKSSEPRTSLKRYLHTLFHVIKWHYGNVWDINSEAHRSVVSVRKLHNVVREDMLAKLPRVDKMFLSQYDMSLVQCGFMGAIIMYPESFAICCQPSELDDYVYFWKWIGYLLGISHHNNICSRGYSKAIQLCHEIEDTVLLPALDNPPKDFHSMAVAFTKGISFITKFRMFTPESIDAFVRKTMKQPGYCETVADRLRVALLQVVMGLVWYVPLVRHILNRCLERFCDCDSMK